MDVFTSLIFAGKVAGGITAIAAALKLASAILWKPLKSKIETIYKELTPNGGGSIKDAINRVQGAVGRMEKRQKCWLQIHDKAVFETDSAGNLTWANREYLGLLGATFEEVEGRGWRNFLASDSTFEQWTRAVADKRDFNACFSFRRKSGEMVPACVESLAMKDERGELLGYVGNVTQQR